MKLTEEEFIEAHPGLKGKLMYNIFPELMVKSGDIHETQIDKQIVEKIINEIDKGFREDVKKAAKSGDFMINSMLVGANLHITKQLKKDLGLSK